MEDLVQFIIGHAEIAHWIVFGSLILAGFNVPISEDLMIVISAMLAATVVPENLYKLFFAVFLGCCLGDSICYATGRWLGPRLWLAKSLKKERVAQIGQYYERYGFWTLIVGRFIPFGVRNGLFLTAGFGKMPFVKFACSDGLACMLSNGTLFSLAYFGGKKYQAILASLKTVNIFLFVAFAIAVIAVIWYKRKGKTTV